MTREEIIKYIEFRASGINQAINYDYKEFYKEMLEMCKQEKQVKQNDLLHSVMPSYNFAYIWLNRKGFREIKLSGKTVEELREKKQKLYKDWTIVKEEQY